jgi:hypothetical protein
MLLHPSYKEIVIPLPPDESTVQTNDDNQKAPFVNNSAGRNPAKPTQATREHKGSMNQE